jgi:hypothetical protein
VVIVAEHHNTERTDMELKNKYEARTQLKTGVKIQKDKQF